MSDTMGGKNPQTARILPRKWIAFSLDTLDGLTSLFIRLRLSPNAITVLALIVGMGAGALFALNEPTWAAVLIIICGILDVMDGKVAVKMKKQSLFGAIFDSTLDRYSEFFLYLGLAVYFRNHWALWITFLTFLGSTMVSYTRARAEGLGIDCKVGVMQRAERMVLLALGSIVGVIFNIFDAVIIGILIFIALVSNYTALQRTFHVKKTEKNQSKRDAPV